MDNSSVLSSYEVLLPSAISYVASKVDVVNLNPDIGLTKKDTGDGIITINLFSNGQVTAASYVPIIVVLNQMEEYTIPDLKQIGYDSTLSLLSDKPILYKKGIPYYYMKLLM